MPSTQETPSDSYAKLPELGKTERPQEYISVGLFPIPGFLKRWLYRVFGDDHA